MKKKNDKKILVIILIIILGIIGFLLIKYPSKDKTGGGSNNASSSSNYQESGSQSSTKNNGSNSNASSSSSKPKVEKDKVVEKKVKIEDSKLVVDKITYTYDGSRYSLFFTINNNTNKDYNLKEYNAYLKDKDGNVISILDAGIFGTIKSKSKSNSMVYYTENISSVYSIEFEKK